MTSAQQEYKQFLKDKRVVLVGPSKTITMQEEGDTIDSYDVVVRLNSMLDFGQQDYKYLGSRTDVVYATLDDPPKKIAVQCIKNSVKYLSSSYPEGEWFFSERMSQNISLLKHVRQFTTIILPEDPYFSIKKKTKSRPNTGFSAIIDLLSSDLKELYIIGVDFYRSSTIDSGEGYYNGYDCQWTKKRNKDFLNIEFDGKDRHDPDEAFKYFKYEMFLKDRRVKVDSIFNIFLQDKKYESLKNFYNLDNQMV